MIPNHRHIICFSKNCIVVSDDGFVGGSYSPSFMATGSASGYPYARLLNDRGGVFSQLFYSDRIGRVIVTQNTKQADYKRMAYSYTLYDALGRAVEGGQKTENTDANTFHTIFGDTVLGFYNPNVISQTKFLAWIKDNTGPRTEVSHTYYDIQDILPNNVLAQQEIRNRPASITYMDTVRTDSLNYTNAIHYSYDIHGNVSTLIQDDSVYGIGGQRYKRLDYKYDIVDHNVNEVDYQSGQIDQYHTAYQYDADKRITQVETSKDSILWDNDANYFYYAHLPTARVEIGDQQVQGVDYAYTLNGYIKGVNSDLLAYNTDMGKDASQSESNLNKNFAKDAFGYTISYFDKSSLIPGDYDAIDKTKWDNPISRFESYNYGSSLMSSRRDLYNGTISAMVTSISKPIKYSSDTSIHSIPLPQGTSYNYNQLNSIVSMRAFQNLGTGSYNTWGNMIYNQLYYDTISYDANGNILTQQRNDSVGGIMSTLNYHYNIEGGRTLQNRLYHVNNTASSPNPLDIKDEGLFDTAESTINQKNNYRYNAMGQLAKDSIGRLDTIIWNNTGRVWEIRKYNGDSIIFTYNANGQRIMKSVIPASGTPTITYYVLNGMGNTIAIYSKTLNSTSHTLSYSLTERDIYGTKRIGADNTPIELVGSPPFYEIDTLNRYLGFKDYELDNHLGNVLVTVSDRKIPRLNNKDSLVYEADVISANDYYPFGMLEPGRNFSSNKYKYGFNGKEKDDETYGNGDEYEYSNRLYDPRLGRFLTIDPYIKKFPFYSAYMYGGNSPIVAVDLDGAEPEEVIDVLGKVTQPVSGFLQGAFGYSSTTVEKTTWVLGVNKMQWEWSKPGAITWGSTVFYSPGYMNDPSISNWVSYVGHEQSHREDVEAASSTLSWFASYLLDYHANRNKGQSEDAAYKNIPTEITAYHRGAVIDQFFKSTDNAQLFFSILNSDIPPAEKSRKMEVLGIEKIAIPTLESEVQDIKSQISVARKYAGTSAVADPLIAALSATLKDKETKIDNLKKKAAELKAVDAPKEDKKQ